MTDERTYWTATYRIKESPGFALIGNVVADTEDEARAWAEGEVGTDIDAWGVPYRLLELLGVNRQQGLER